MSFRTFLAAAVFAFVASSATAQTPPPVDHSQHRGSLVSSFAMYSEDPTIAQPMTDAVVRAVTGDTESLAPTLVLIPGSINDFHFFRSPAYPTLTEVWAHLSYRSRYNEIVETWVLARFRDGALECLAYKDSLFGCQAPHPGSTTLRAQLGQGRPHLGPISVASSCFSTRTVSVPRSRRVMTGTDPSGYPQYRNEYYSENIDQTIYACPSQHFEFECVNDAQSANVGRTLNLVTGQVTNESASSIAVLNSRIQSGSCVRTR